MSASVLSTPEFASASMHIRALTCGLPFALRKKRLMLMLRAYFDDSGSDQKGPFYVLAGFVAPVPAWESFSDEWEQILKLSPSLGYVKATEAMRLKDQFRGWTPQQRNDRLALLGQVTRKHVLAGVGVAVRQRDYEEVIRGHVNERVDNPYFVCFVAVIELLLKYMDDLGFKDKIDFVFDEQTIERKVRPLFDLYKAWPWQFANRMGSLDFRSDKEVLPLQSADLIAWATRRQLLAKADDDNIQELQIGPHPKVYINVVGSDLLSKIRDEAKKYSKQILLMKRADAS